MARRDSGTSWERFVGWTHSYHLRFFLGAFLLLIVVTFCLGW